MRSTPADIAGNGVQLVTTAAGAAPGPERRPSRGRPRRWLVIALVLAGAAALGAALLGRSVREWLAPPPPAGLLFASGRIEGRITTLTPKTSAWVAALHVDEGQAVQAGQLLATLDDQAQRERLRAADAQLRALTERLRAADIQLAMTARQVGLQVEQAEAGRREADTRVRRTRAQALQAQHDAERAAALVGRELIAPQEAEH